MGSEVVLLDFWPSPFGMRVRIALAEKGVNYEYKEEDLWNKSELLLKMNPVHKKIPVLIHNNKPMNESLIIVEYIDEIWGDKASLLPFDPYQLSNARFWADFVEKKMFDTQKKVWSAQGEDQEAAKKEFIDQLKMLEKELADKPYFGGDKFGFFDVVLIPYYCWFYAYERVGNFKIKESCPKIIEWGKRCMQRESVAKTLPNQTKVYEYVLGLKKRLGI